MNVSFGQDQKIEAEDTPGSADMKTTSCLGFASGIDNIKLAEQLFKDNDFDTYLLFNFLFAFAAKEAASTTSEALRFFSYLLGIPNIGQLRCFIN